MTDSPQPNNPLHGITLETIVTQLVERYGWADMLALTCSMSGFIKSHSSLR
ncbi:MAG: VF530 family DNA-binding protein [Anaerolineae bacterium]|nr:VF530 family DNA-binding protein [Anaerolineae bacterium]